MKICKNLMILTAPVLLLLSDLCLAVPKPLGLELGKATVEEMQDLYITRGCGTNMHSEGPMFDIDTTGIELKNLSAARAVFNPEGTLEAVQMVFFADKNPGRKGTFEELFASFKKKYQLVKKKIPFVGDKYARFKDGRYIVEIDSPHLSFDLTVTYQSPNFEKAVKTGQKQRETREREQIRDLL